MSAAICRAVLGRADVQAALAARRPFAVYLATAEEIDLTTLEEALSDLEKQSKKVKSDCDAWKRRAGELEAELQRLAAAKEGMTQND